MLATSFEHNLRQQLEADPKLRRRGLRILAVLNERPSKRRTRRVARMEAHSAAHLGLTGAIDWSKIDWQKVVMAVLQMLLALLPFILML